MSAAACWPALRTSSSSARAAVAGRRTVHQHVAVADDDRQQVVEIVRDAAGETADRFELLRLPELILARLQRALGALPIGDVAEQADQAGRIGEHDARERRDALPHFARFRPQPDFDVVEDRVFAQIGDDDVAILRVGPYVQFLGGVPDHLVARAADQVQPARVDVDIAAFLERRDGDRHRARVEHLGEARRAVGQLAVQAAELIGHLVERTREHADFVLARDRRVLGEIARRDAARGAIDRQERRRDAPCEHQHADRERARRDETGREDRPGEPAARRERGRLRHLGHDRHAQFVDPAPGAEHGGAVVVGVGPLAGVAADRRVDPHAVDPARKTRTSEPRRRDEHVVAIDQIDLAALPEARRRAHDAIHPVEIQVRAEHAQRAIRSRLAERRRQAHERTAGHRRGIHGLDERLLPSLDGVRVERARLADVRGIAGADDASADRGEDEDLVKIRLLLEHGREQCPRFRARGRIEDRGGALAVVRPVRAKRRGRGAFEIRPRGEHEHIPPLSIEPAAQLVAFERGGRFEPRQGQTRQFLPGAHERQRAHGHHRRPRQQQEEADEAELHARAPPAPDHGDGSPRSSRYQTAFVFTTCSTITLRGGEPLLT